MPLLFEDAPSSNGVDKGEAAFRDLAESSAIAFHMVGPDGTILWANAAELALLGYEADAYIGRDIRNFHADRDRIEWILGVLLRGERLTNCEARLVAKDGSFREVLIDSSPFFHEGQFVHSRCSTRDVTEQKKATRRLAAQQAVTAILSTSKDFATAQRPLIEAICRTADWEVGLLWLVDPTAEVLRCSAFVANSNREFPEFEVVSRGQAFEYGAALPGRVWAQGEPLWIEDITQNLSFVRADAGEHEGLHGAFAFPIILDGEVLGVLEFFSREIRQPDATFIELLKGFGNQIGQFIERKHAEQSLRESEQRFREMIDALPAAIYTTDARGRVTHYNPAAVEFSGRIPTIGSDEWCVTWKLYSADGSPLPHDKCPMAVILKEGRAVRGVEAIAERPDGSRVWFTPYPTPFKDEQGRVIGGINMLVDITERKESEAKVRNIAEQLSLVANTAPIYIAHCDAQQRYKLVNRAYAQWFDRSPEDCIGKTVREVAGTEAYANARPYIERVLSGERVDFETEISHPHKGSRFMHCAYAPERDANERVVGWVAAITDISERKRIEESLRRETQRLEAVNFLGKLLGAETDLQRIVQTATDVATNMTGAKFGAFFYNVVNESGETYTLYTLSGAPRSAFEKFGVPRKTAIFEPTFHGTAVVRLDDVTKDPRYGKNAPHHGMPTGHLPVTSYLAVPVTSRSGKVLGGLFFGHPEPGRFTEQHERLAVGLAGQAAIVMDNAQLVERLGTINATLEQRVAERSREAEHRAVQLRTLSAQLMQTEQRERKRLAAILHDHLQQYLVAAKMRLRLATKNANASAMTEAVTGVTQLIDQAIAQARTLTVELRPPVLYEDGLVAALLWLSRWMEQHSGLNVTIDSSRAMEPRSDDVKALAFEAVRELLVNVVKHAGVNAASVSLDTWGNDMILITVSDKGKGFDPQSLYHNPATDGGYGVMSIRERMMAFGGALEVDSSKGRGTSVRLKVPIASGLRFRNGREDRNGGYGDPASGLQRREPSESGKTVRVLLVDDHKIVRLGIANLLSQDQRIRVVGQADDGHQAIEQVALLEPDVVIMDINMPGISGVEATRRIKAQWPEVRIIGLSVHGEEEVAESMRRAGASAYFNKGGDTDLLIEAIVSGEKDPKDKGRS